MVWLEHFPRFYGNLSNSLDNMICNSQESSFMIFKETICLNLNILINIPQHTFQPELKTYRLSESNLVTTLPYFLCTCKHSLPHLTHTLDMSNCLFIKHVQLSTGWAGNFRTYYCLSLFMGEYSCCQGSNPHSIKSRFVGTFDAQESNSKLNLCQVAYESRLEWFSHLKEQNY